MMFYISLVVAGIVTQGHNKDEFIQILFKIYSNLFNCQVDNSNVCE